jgi:hypothetical protein
MFIFLWLWFIFGAKRSLCVAGQSIAMGCFPTRGFYELNSIPVMTLRAERQPAVKLATGSQKLLS